MFGQHKKERYHINGSTKNFNAEKEGKIWTFLLENDVIAEIHCSLPTLISTDNLYSEIFTSEK